MNTSEIIVEINAQISRLQEAKALLAGTEITIERKPGRPSLANLSDRATSIIRAKVAVEPVAKRTVSDEAREKMAAAQKARWAKVKRASKRAARNVAAALALKSAAPKGVAPKTASAKKSISTKKSTPSKTKPSVTAVP